MEKYSALVKRAYPWFVCLVAPYAVYFGLGVLEKALRSPVTLSTHSNIFFAYLFLALVPGALCLLRIPGWSIQKRLCWTASYFPVMGFAFIVTLVLLYHFVLYFSD